MATHYGVGILPARPRRSRDKAAVEAGVRLAPAYILGRLRAWSLRQAEAASWPASRPSWTWLRSSLPVLVGGDCIENLSTMVALDLVHPMAGWQGVVLWIGSIASAIKWTGALGCVALALLGVTCRFAAIRRQGR